MVEGPRCRVEIDPLNLTTTRSIRDVFNEPEVCVRGAAAFSPPAFHAQCYSILVAEERKKTNQTIVSFPQ